MIPNFPITSNQAFSQKCLELGLYSFQDVVEYILQLPYHRNSSKSDLSLVLTEQCGTCSTKHAALALLAKENNFPNLKLILGIYEMNESNTPGVGHVLMKNNLDYIPEAHVYLMIEKDRIDITRTVASETSAFDVLLLEKEIQPDEIDSFKVNFHKSFIDIWRKENKINFSLDELWEIRENCIHALANFNL